MRINATTVPDTGLPVAAVKKFVLKFSNVAVLSSIVMCSYQPQLNVHHTQGAKQNRKTGMKCSHVPGILRDLYCHICLGL